MTQYSYETHTLNAIIIAARTGVLHPSLVTPREMAAQLVDIKLNLPMGNFTERNIRIHKNNQNSSVL